jgi:hypothetical protein
MAVQKKTKKVTKKVVKEEPKLSPAEDLESREKKVNLGALSDEERADILIALGKRIADTLNVASDTLNKLLAVYGMKIHLVYTITDELTSFVKKEGQPAKKTKKTQGK